MQKFLVLYGAPVAAMQEMMKTMTPEKGKQQIAEWGAWMENNKTYFVDQGAAAGKNLRVTASGASQVSNEIGGYSIMQAESAEALAEVFKGMSHFQIPGAYVEIMPLIDMSNK